MKKKEAKNGQAVRGIRPLGITTQQCRLQRLHQRTAQSNNNLRWRGGEVTHRSRRNPMLAIFRNGVPGPTNTCTPSGLLGSWGAAVLPTHCFISRVCGLCILLCMICIYNFAYAGFCVGFLKGPCSGLLLSEMGLGMRLSKLCYHK